MIFQNFSGGEIVNTAVSGLNNINAKEVSSKNNTNKSSSKSKDKFSDIVKSAVKDTTSNTDVKNDTKAEEVSVSVESANETKSNTGETEAVVAKDDNEVNAGEVDDSAAAVLIALSLVDTSSELKTSAELSATSEAFGNISSINNIASAETSENANANVALELAGNEEVTQKTDETGIKIFNEVIKDTTSKSDTAQTAAEIELKDASKEIKTNNASVEKSAENEPLGTKLTIESGNERLDTKQDYDVNEHNTNGAFTSTLNNNDAVQTDNIFVKVSDGKTVDSSEAINELADKITHRTLENAEEFNIQLNPKELGSLNIKVLFEDGKTQLSIICSNSKSFNLISDNIGALSSIIKANTGNEVNINVQENSEYFNERQDLNQENSQHERREQSGGNKKYDEQKALDFVQQLRIGLA